MKIRNVEIKNEEKNDIKKSGYYNVFGDEKIAEMIRKIQSTTIRNGNELEHIIFSLIDYQVLLGSITTENILRRIIQGEDFCVSSWVLSKRELNSVGINLSGKNATKVDMLLYRGGELYIMELKQGEALDTKKSQSEIESLNMVKEYFNRLKIEAHPKLILWVSDDIKNSSIKTNQNREYIITGREACDIIGISYEDVEEVRRRDQEDNKKWLFEMIFEIIDPNIIDEKMVLSINEKLKRD